MKTITNKQNMNAYLVFGLLASLSLLGLINPSNTYAVCPVCTVAVAGGVGLSRLLGIDDLVSGVWIGGLVYSLSVMTRNYLSNKTKINQILDFSKFKKLDLLLILNLFFYFLLVFIPLHFGNITGHSLNKIFGIDKLLFGSLFGVFIFYLSENLDTQIRKFKGKQIILYQKVIIPIAALSITSLVLFILTK